MVARQAPSGSRLAASIADEEPDGGDAASARPNSMEAPPLGERLDVDDIVVPPVAGLESVRVDEREDVGLETCAWPAEEAGPVTDP